MATRNWIGDVLTYVGYDADSKEFIFRSEKMFENKVMLDGSVREPVGDTHQFGPRVADKPTDPKEPMEVTVYLSDEGMKNSSDVNDYLVQRGFLANWDLTKKSITVSGTAEQFQSAFGVQLNDVVRANVQYRERVGGVMIPQEWQGKVTAILGLDNHPAASPRCTTKGARYSSLEYQQSIVDDILRDLKSNTAFAARAAANPRVGAVPLFAAQCCKAYNFPQGLGDGSNLMIGILSLGGGYKDADLTRFCNDRKIPKADVKWVSVDGAINRPGSDADVENALDICVIVDALAYAGLSKAKIRVFVGPNSTQGFVNCVRSAATYAEDGVKCSALSCSWGSAEPNNTKMQMTAFDDSIKMLLGIGAVFTSASGDDGSSDGTPTRAVDYPASSPYTLGIGGTTVVLDSNGNRLSEKVWNNGVNQGAGGGGVSAVYPRPAYQSAFSLPSRGVPDWSANADPASGYRIVANGMWTSVGGTSGASPLCAALIVILKSRGLTVKPHGDGSSVHTLSYNSPSAFFDVTMGNNGDYPAGPNYDVASGIGVPDGQRMITAFGLNDPPPTQPPPVIPPPTVPLPPLPPNIVGLMTLLNQYVLAHLGLEAHRPISATDYFSIGKK